MAGDIVLQLRDKRYPGQHEMRCEAADEIQRLRGLLRSCVRGTEVVDLGAGELIGLHLPNKPAPKVEA